MRMDFPYVSQVVRFTGLREYTVPISALREGDVFRIEGTDQWMKAVSAPFLTEGTAGGYAVMYEPQQLLLENK